MKKIVNSLFVLVFGLGLVSGGMVNVGAAVVDSKSTNASIIFEQEKTDDGVEVAPLRLDSVTSAIEFGTETNTFEKITSESTSNTVELELTDNRGYNPAAGWVLTAELSPFSKYEGNNKLEGVTLPGSSISFTNVSSRGTTNELGELVFDEPVVEQFILESNGEPENKEKIVATAQRTDKPNQGVGPWTFNWEDITLNVPAGASSEGTHKATITWSLSDVPQG